MHDCINISQEETSKKTEFVKYIAMLIKKYGNLDIKKNQKKEAA